MNNLTPEWIKEAIVELKDLRNLMLIITGSKYNPQELLDSRDADLVIALIDAETARQSVTNEDVQRLINQYQARIDQYDDIVADIYNSHRSEKEKKFQTEWQNKRLAENKTVLTALRQMKPSDPCPECAKWANDFYFCPDCGRKLESEETV